MSQSPHLVAVPLTSTPVTAPQPPEAEAQTEVRLPDTPDQPVATLPRSDANPSQPAAPTRLPVRGAKGEAQRGPVTDGALALRYQDVPEVQVAPARPVLRLVPSGPSLPDAQAWAPRLVQALAEVLAGDRPIGQLVRFTDTVVFADVSRRVRVLGLTTTATARGAKERSAVRSVHVFTPATEIAEVAAHVRYGDRSRAMALRLEVHRGRWICTALELG
ncbi:hypothetical protein EV644_101546 [Kribbella orskensis]|uniref:Uncharacterized protein n=1 Tax=Kribbella orskensis TaxID=2512216 RepID=A0ABY2BV52_9ACTN|nr:hypothetical protein EV642_101443 [Kribbella sp. VKM Ac-2500]TCO31903.1 hypothetical protein EV644_101546 [Kribbella orskensis]